MPKDDNFQQIATEAPTMHSEFGGRVLRCWKDIARHLDVSVRTVQRWEREFGLPIRRVCPGHGKPVHAFVAELDAWRTRVEAATRVRSEQPDRLAGEARPLAAMTAVSSTLKTIAAGLIGWIGK